MPANANFNEVVTTTIKNRQRELADNVTTHHPLLKRLNERGNIILEDGGETLVEELDFAENPNFLFYTGYEQLSTQEGDVLSAAEFAWKQAAVTLTMSGREQRQNMGRERMINLLDGRINNAMRTMANNLAIGLASDGTGFSGKQITGLLAAVADDPTTGVYGGIDPASFTFWQNQVVNGGAISASTIQGFMNELWLACIRGMDSPDLITAGLNRFNSFWQSLQTIQRISQPTKGESGFRSLMFQGPMGEATVFYDSTLDTTRMYFLNTDFIKWKVHPDANMSTLDRRQSINQDAMVIPIIWQGNLTTSNRARQGVLIT